MCTQPFMDKKIEIRRFDAPDNQLDFASHGQIDVVNLPGGAMGMHAILKPGWQWSVDEKPLLGNPESCPMPHTGYCISGELIVRMIDSGEETCIRKGDFFEIPAGHDGYVPGQDACELILFQSAESSAAQSAA